MDSKLVGTTFLLEKFNQLKYYLYVRPRHL